ncbi:hypothetical protein ASG35_05740 [Burkholderia sp. Leaf177]|uniref:DUF4387 domain-containing protein n=1 Tax=Burkholderia sp. Leaf177 TaxID=1736287 RepID=UPI0006FF747C|nr:DUF4387 domain-containing protein [Burkholderia sp. Leaf177]KQR81785.1 hypothetical protein ASG35_05740 [Burkholderia sp. Leaf177]
MKIVPLSSLATVIRSKNAGPFLLTFDIMFEDASNYETVWKSGCFTKAAMAQLFRVDASAITSIFAVPRGQAIKVTMRRQLPQGRIGESDMYGCQQHVPLLDLPISGFES